ncbi:hypothetical protein U9M48_017707 [Paspalum notatum var. saurae]|uniref:F-box domain-containing protein n=1 Tax=Paspalum notatum var. saurae TaxID=547442 RepID=A0AAQ3WP31_PASNO
MGRRPRKRRHRRAAAAAAEGPDCFSHLTEDLLRSILNRLSTRFAARLAAVSRHFRREVPALLERVDSLTLTEPAFEPSLPETPPLLLRRLDIAPHRVMPASAFRAVLNDAAQHGLSELGFRLVRRQRLPKNVLSVKSLVVLDLNTCAVPPWCEARCPCLRTLKLQRVAIHQDTINRILVSASCLETLEMEYCTGFGTGKDGGCTLVSPSVRYLVFRPTQKQAETAIRASGLRMVTLYTRGRAKKLELASAPEITKAYLHFAKSPRIMESFTVRPFLDAGVRLQCLKLGGHAMKILSSEYEEIPKLMVMFQDLRILSVSVDLSNEQEPVFLLKLLESCPNLQKFTLSVAGKCSENNLPPSVDPTDRLASISCLTSSLVQFKFRGFKPQEYQKKLMGFLLTQAMNLKMVHVEFEKNDLATVEEMLSVRTGTVQNKSTKYKKSYIQMDYS